MRALDVMEVGVRLGSQVGFAVVRGRSMLPTLRDGDRLLVRYGARVRPGDLVVVSLRSSAGPAVLAVKRAGHREQDGWWVERDNPAEGVDSWSYGVVPDADVLARVLLRIGLPRLGRARRTRG